MPNWCNNNITITGNNQTINRIEQITKDDYEEIDRYCKEKNIEWLPLLGTLIAKFFSSNLIANLI